MKTNTANDRLLKAISNNIRRDIFDYILKEKFVIKSEIITQFNLQRAGLDFHLTALEEAGLIGLLEIKIKGRKYVYVYPKSIWKIELESLETYALHEALPPEVTITEFPQLAEKLWLNSSIIKNPETIKRILESITAKLDDNTTTILCHRCKSNLGIMKCSKCLDLYCTDCAKIILRPDTTKVAFCSDCIADDFS